MENHFFRNLLVRLRPKDQEIVHAIGFHKIAGVRQFVPGLPRLANNDVFPHTMIRSAAIAINDADLGTRSQRLP